MSCSSVFTRSRFGGIQIGLFAVILLAASARSAGAATYQNVDCYCSPTTNAVDLPDFSSVDPGHSNYAVSRGCICSQSFTLSKLGTKEFRFRCKHDNARELPAYQNAVDRDKPTTCTITGTMSLDYAHDEYGTMSCTNWSTLSTDTLKLQTVCALK